MDQCQGFDKENIDKSKILISEHAEKRLILRVERAYQYFSRQGIPKNSLQNKVGVPLIKTGQEAKTWMGILLQKSTAVNSATNGKSVDSILEYLKTGKITFFLRYERWQFIITQSRENPDKLILKTVIWLDDNLYGKIRK